MKNREKPKSTKSLRDLIDSINWVAIEGGAGVGRLPLDAVSIQFTQKSKKQMKDNNADLVRIRIGQQVLEKLGWNPGSKIYICHDPDDHLTFLLAKVETKAGHTLCQESGTHSCRLHFSWGRERLPMEMARPILIKYEIHKKQLIFKAIDA